MRHALGDYGVKGNKLHVEILAQSNTSGGGGSGSGNGNGVCEQYYIANYYYYGDINLNTVEYDHFCGKGSDDTCIMGYVVFEFLSGNVIYQNTIKMSCSN